MKIALRTRAEKSILMFGHCTAVGLHYCLYIFVYKAFSPFIDTFFEAVKKFGWIAMLKEPSGYKMIGAFVIISAICGFVSLASKIRERRAIDEWESKQGSKV